MDIIELGAIGELVGGVAVLATLAYLAVQTRNAARFSSAEAPQRILDGFKTWFQPLKTDPEFTRLVRFSLHRWSELPYNDQARFHAFSAEGMVHLEAVLALRAKGLVSEELAQAWENNMLGLIVTPGGGEWWEASKFLYPSETIERLDQRLRDRDSLPPPWFEAPFYGLEESDYAVFQAGS